MHPHIIQLDLISFNLAATIRAGAARGRCDHALYIVQCLGAVYSASRHMAPQLSDHIFLLFIILFIFLVIFLVRDSQATSGETLFPTSTKRHFTITFQSIVFIVT